LQLFNVVGQVAQPTTSDPFATRHVSTTDGHADTDKPVVPKSTSPTAGWPNVQRSENASRAAPSALSLVRRTSGELVFEHDDTEFLFDQ
jgi:hypothetical protein